MQRIYQNYALELARKSELLLKLTGSDDTSTPPSLVDNARVLQDVMSELSSKQHSGAPHFGISKDALSHCIEQWADESEASLVDAAAISGTCTLI